MLGDPTCRRSWALSTALRPPGGIFITTTRFSAEAKDYAERVNARLILIDGPELANLMIEHNCGVVEEETFTLKQVDENFFGDL